MKYFIDTEFLEGTQDKTILGIKYGQTKPTIDLISIALVGEDGREYYAVSKDFNLKEAWNRCEEKIDWNQQKKIKRKERNTIKEYWIRENVLKPIYNELAAFHINYTNHGVHSHFGHACTDSRFLSFTYKNLKWLIKKYGKTNKQIAEEIKEFVNINFKTFCNFNGEAATNILNGKRYKAQKIYNSSNYNKPEFYGYYADYDWVAFCWLFGKMMDLPKGFLMYCRDLKQELDNYVSARKKLWGEKAINFDMLNHIKTLPDYPKQTNEHNALADARWNRELYKFLESL